MAFLPYPTIIKSAITSLIAAAMLMNCLGCGGKQEQAEAEFDLTTLPLFRRPALWVGDPAPPLHQLGGRGATDLTHYFPTDSIPPGDIHVVEFWATWCKPCIASFPHLSELQRQYQEHATVVGVNVKDSEKGESESSRIERVGAFVETQRERMTYPVVVGKSPESEDSWLAASGLAPGLPFAFIVDQNACIAWMGHPNGLEQPLKDLVSRTYDRQAFTQALEERLTAGMQLDAVVEMLEKADPSQGYAAMQALVSGPFSNQPKLLRELAMTVTTSEDVAIRDLESAWEAADLANELTGRDNPWFLIASAEVAFARGEIESAVSLARAAREGCKPHFEEWYDEQLARFTGESG